MPSTLQPPPVADSALQIYDTAVLTTAPYGPQWCSIAALLLDEATRCTGEQRAKRVTRAEECMARSQRLGSARMAVVH